MQEGEIGPGEFEVEERGVEAGEDVEGGVGGGEGAGAGDGGVEGFGGEWGREDQGRVDLFFGRGGGLARGVFYLDEEVGGGGFYVDYGGLVL